MSQRGMKKWAPFAALPEQNKFTIEVKKSKKIEQEKIISEDQIYEIENILSNYHGEYVEIEYFDKTTLFVSGFITKIDTTYKVLYIDKQKIKIASIKNIKTN